MTAASKRSRGHQLFTKDYLSLSSIPSLSNGMNIISSLWRFLPFSFYQMAFSNFDITPSFTHSAATSSSTFSYPCFLKSQVFTSYVPGLPIASAAMSLLVAMVFLSSHLQRSCYLQINKVPFFHLGACTACTLFTTAIHAYRRTHNIFVGTEDL